MGSFSSLFNFGILKVVTASSIILATFSGCLTYFGITLNSEKPLVEPISVPDTLDNSTEFSAYRNFAIASDSSAFAETIFVTDSGSGGLTQTLGTIPFRKIANRNIESLVSNHFRTPLQNERPAAVFEITPMFISVKQSGKMARAKLSIAFKCIKQDTTRTVLLDNIYTCERTSSWSKGEVPIALYDTFNGLFSEFLKDFITKVRPASLMDGPESNIKMPELKSLSFESKDGNFSVIGGICSVSCNGWESFQTAAWAKQQIFSQCVEHLGVEKERVRVRYDNETTKYDAQTKSWTFGFSTWARTRMALQYNASSRNGCAIVDLGLFNGTSEDAAKAAKDYIIKEMNLRAAAYNDEAPEVKADIEFRGIETEAENNLVIVNFKLIY